VISFELGQVMNMRGLENLICGAKGAELSHFSFSQILAATDNLSERNLVGNGGFGYVYKVMFSRENLYYEKVTELLKNFPKCSSTWGGASQA
jgi:hypothetical protein